MVRGFVFSAASKLLQKQFMHYKNGREAKAGDQIVLIQNAQPLAGILHSLNDQSDTCNGRLATSTSNDPYVNIKDCLHVDDVKAATIPDSTKK